jgi:hypothetical protein
MLDKTEGNTQRKQLILVIEYGLCVITLLGLPSAIISIGMPGTSRYLYALTIVSCLLITNRVIRLKLKIFSKITLLIATLFIITLIRNIESEGIDSINLYSWYGVFFMHNSRYYFLSIAFLCYPLLLSRFQLTRKNDFILKSLFTLNVALLPIFHLLHGSSIGPQGTLISKYQLLDDVTYNGYLYSSDGLLFSALILVILRQDLISVIINFLCFLFLFLIGSRISTLAALFASLVLIISFTLKYIASNDSTNKILKLKISRSQIRNFFILLLLVFILLFPGLRFSNLNFDTFTSNRVYHSFFVSQVTEDDSLDYRTEYWNCFYDRITSNSEIIFFGDPDFNDRCSGYIHSTLSVLVDFGLITFSIYLTVLFLSIKTLLKEIQARCNYQLFLHLLNVSVFLFIGFSARAGISLALPALAFAYSSALLVRTSRHKSSFIQANSMAKQLGWLTDKTLNAGG